LIGELHERGVAFVHDEKKEVLVKKLEDTMCGTHHVPALMFQSSFVNTEKLGIDTYEVINI